MKAAGSPVLLDAILTIGDHVRREILYRLGWLARPFVVDRELRVALGLSGLLLSSLLFTLLVPLWMLMLSPLILGVPHLVGDLRYLVVRPGFHRRWALLLVLPAMGASALGFGYGPGFLAVALAFVCARGPWGLRAVGCGVAVVLSGVSFWLGYAMDLVMAHVHNLVALALVLVWRPWERQVLRWPLLLFGVIYGAILAGLFDGLCAAGLSMTAGNTDLAYHANWLAGDLEGPLAARLVVSFAFAQAVHYGVFVRILPDLDRKQKTPRSFRASYRALLADFGGVLLWLFGMVALGLLIWASWDLEGARTGYFRLALFHGPLELCALSIFLAEKRRPVGYASGKDAECRTAC